MLLDVPAAVAAQHPELVRQRHIPRIARLMALAIRFEGMLRDETIQDYAELARPGRVTRARITQIMKLLHLRTGHSGADSFPAAHQRS